MGDHPITLVFLQHRRQEINNNFSFALVNTRCLFPDSFAAHIEGAIVVTGRRTIGSIDITMSASPQRAASAIDPKIAAQSGKGDLLAFSRLYDQSSTILFSLAMRIVGNREHAAEILESVYIDIWRRAVRYDVGRGTPIAWLLTMTRNRAIDRLRASDPCVSRQGGSNDDSRNAPPGEFKAPADQALRTVISKALTELSPSQRQTIEWSYYEGLLPVEIATRLGEPLDAVIARLRLGISKLRESFYASWEQNKSA